MPKKRPVCGGCLCPVTECACAYMRPRPQEPRVADADHPYRRPARQGRVVRQPEGLDSGPGSGNRSGGYADPVDYGNLPPLED